MKFVIAMVIIIGFTIGGYQLWEYWGKFKEKDPNAPVAAAPEIPGDQLPGLPQKLQPLLQSAQQKGADGLREFLATYGSQIDDPRKAWIELDYVVLLSQSDPGKARQKFAEVKSRVDSGSPVYNRVKQLEKTYE